MGVLALAKQHRPKQEHQQVNDAIMSKAMTEYRSCIQFLTMRGVKVTEEMAQQIKEDVISYKIIMEY